MAGTKEPGPTGQHPNSGIVPSRTPGPPGINDQADPTVIAQQGDTPGAAGVNDYHPPRLLNAGAGPNNPTGQQDTYGSAPIVGTGLSSVTRIPVPGTGLYIELTPRGRIPKGGSTSALFIQDEAGKRTLRLDYGINKVTGKVDYHWNQKGTFAEFGIEGHTPAGSAGEVLFKGAKFLKYGGRALLIVGVAMDVYSIVVAKKRWRQVARVAAGWAGAEAAGTLGGEWLAGVGTMIEPGGGKAVGGVVGFIVFGTAGYLGASWATGEVYDYVEEIYFESVPLTDRP